MDTTGTPKEPRRTMASVALSRRVEKVVGYPPLVEMSEDQRREFHEALLDAGGFEDLPRGELAAASLNDEGRPRKPALVPVLRSHNRAPTRAQEVQFHAHLVDDADFLGQSGSFTVLHGTAGWPDCPDCGSSLYGRREAVRNRGAAVLEVFRCRCGWGRHVQRQVAAA